MTDTSNERSNRTGLHVGLWVAQVLLALAFGLSGWMKASTPMPDLVEMMAWAESLPAWLVRFIGISELAGAVGLVLPAATGVKPKLTGIAGACLVVVMVLAAGLHVVRAEFGFILVNAALGGLAAFVAWGRLKGRPVE